MSDQEQPAEAHPAKPPKSKGGLLTTVLLVANLGATGAVAFMVKGIRSAPAHGPAPTAHAPSSGSGPVATLDPFVVNLNEPGSSRYLKATFEVEMSDKAAAGELTKAKRAIRDQVMRYLSNLSVADTLGEARKEKIQAELVARIDKELGGGKVKRMYFTDFVVQ
jgi:flagellar protein FliL